MIDAALIDELVSETHMPFLCGHFFPQGKRDGQEWKIGDITGKKGESLGIQLTGNKAGYWHDRATGEGGTFPKLVALHLGYEQRKGFPEVMRAIGAALGRNVDTPNGSTTSHSFDFAKCSAAVVGKDRFQLGEWRSLSAPYVDWLVQNRLIGRYKGCWATPLYCDGTVVSPHWRIDPATPGQKVEWKYFSGCHVAPLIIGELVSADTVHCFDSQWDQFNFDDQCSAHRDKAIVTISTRGSSTAGLLSVIPEHVGTIYLWPQNDDAGLNQWLPKALSILEKHQSVIVVRVPERFKDIGEWVKEGAEKEHLIEAIRRASESARSTGGTQAKDKPGTAIPPESQFFAGDLAKFCTALDAYYHLHRQDHYAISDGRGRYMERNIGAMKRELQRRNCPSEYYNAVLTYLDHHKGVDFIGSLAGWPVGVHEFNQRKLLVTSGADIIEGQEGDCADILAILERMLGEERRYLLGWLKVARQSLCNQAHRPLQSVILCGPKGCGKSFSQEHIITPILGGRYADPFDYVTRQTRFNSELMGAEHWLIDDKEAVDDPYSRATLAFYMRRIASSSHWYTERKGVDGLTLPATPRLTISCNDDEDSLRVLPALTASLEGKVMALYCHANDYPWPKNDAAYEKLAGKIKAQMPAFADYLDCYKIPEEFQDSRYGIKGYQDEVIGRKLRKIGDEFEALSLGLQMIEKQIPPSSSFKGQAGEWFEEIWKCGDGFLRDPLRRIAGSPNTIGKLLKRLADNKVAGVYATSSHNRVYYEIDASVVDL